MERVGGLREARESARGLRAENEKKHRPAFPLSLHLISTLTVAGAVAARAPSDPMSRAMIAYARDGLARAARRASVAAREARPFVGVVAMPAEGEGVRAWAGGAAAAARDWGERGRVIFWRRRLVDAENDRATSARPCPPRHPWADSVTHPASSGARRPWWGGVGSVCVCVRWEKQARARVKQARFFFFSLFTPFPPLSRLPARRRVVESQLRDAKHTPLTFPPMRLFACCARPAASSDDGDAARHAPLRAGAFVSPSPAWAAPDVVPSPKAARGPGKAAVEPRPSTRTTRRVVRGARVALGPHYALSSAAGPVAPPSARGMSWTNSVETDGPPSPDRRAARAAALAAGARALACDGHALPPGPSAAVAAAALVSADTAVSAGAAALALNDALALEGGRGARATFAHGALRVMSAAAGVAVRADLFDAGTRNAAARVTAVLTEAAEADAAVALHGAPRPLDGSAAWLLSGGAAAAAARAAAAGGGPMAPAAAAARKLAGGGESAAAGGGGRAVAGWLLSCDAPPAWTAGAALLGAVARTDGGTAAGGRTAVAALAPLLGGSGHAPAAAAAARALSRVIAADPAARAALERDGDALNAAAHAVGQAPTAHPPRDVAVLLADVLAKETAPRAARVDERAAAAAAASALRSGDAATLDAGAALAECLAKSRGRVGRSALVSAGALAAGAAALDRPLARAGSGGRRGKGAPISVAVPSAEAARAVASALGATAGSPGGGAAATAATAAGAPRALVRALRSDDAPARNAAAAALAALVEASTSAARAAAGAGAIPALADLLSCDASGASRADAALALASVLAEAPAASQSALDAGVLHSLADVLDRGVVAERAGAASALAALAAAPDASVAAALARSPSLLPRLAAAATAVEPRVAAPALAALGNVAASGSAGAAAVVSAGGVAPLAHALDSDSVALRVAGAAGLFSLTRADAPAAMVTVTEPDTLASLVRLLDDEESLYARIAAADALAAAAAAGGRRAAAAIADAGAVEPLVRLYNEPHTRGALDCDAVPASGDADARRSACVSFSRRPASADTSAPTTDLIVRGPKFGRARLAAGAALGVLSGAGVAGDATALARALGPGVADLRAAPSDGARALAAALTADLTAAGAPADLLAPTKGRRRSSAGGGRAAARAAAAAAGSATAAAVTAGTVLGVDGYRIVWRASAASPSPGAPAPAARPAPVGTAEWLGGSGSTTRAATRGGPLATSAPGPLPVSAPTSPERTIRSSVPSAAALVAGSPPPPRPARGAVRAVLPASDLGPLGAASASSAAAAASGGGSSSTESVHLPVAAFGASPARVRAPAPTLSPSPPRARPPLSPARLPTVTPVRTSVVTAAVARATAAAAVPLAPVAAVPPAAAPVRQPSPPASPLPQAAWVPPPSPSAGMLLAGRRVGVSVSPSRATAGDASPFAPPPRATWAVVPPTSGPAVLPAAPELVAEPLSPVATQAAVVAKEAAPRASGAGEVVASPSASVRRSTVDAGGRAPPALEAMFAAAAKALDDEADAATRALGGVAAKAKASVEEARGGGPVAAAAPPAVLSANTAPVAAAPVVAPAVSLPVPVAAVPAVPAVAARPTAVAAPAPPAVAKPVVAAEPPAVPKAVATPPTVPQTVAAPPEPPLVAVAPLPPPASPPKQSPPAPAPVAATASSPTRRVINLTAHAGSVPAPAAPAAPPPALVETTATKLAARDTVPTTDSASAGWHVAAPPPQPACVVRHAAAAKAAANAAVAAAAAAATAAADAAAAQSALEKKASTGAADMARSVLAKMGASRRRSTGGSEEGARVKKEVAVQAAAPAAAPQPTPATLPRPVIAMPAAPSVIQPQSSPAREAARAATAARRAAQRVAAATPNVDAAAPWVPRGGSFCIPSKANYDAGPAFAVDYCHITAGKRAADVASATASPLRGATRPSATPLPPPAPKGVLACTLSGGRKALARSLSRSRDGGGSSARASRDGGNLKVGMDAGPVA